MGTQVRVGIDQVWVEGDRPEAGPHSGTGREAGPTGSGSCARALGSCQSVAFPSDDLRKFHLHPDQVEIGNGRCRLEFYEEVHVAFRQEALSQYRAEQGKFAEVMALAEVVNRGLGYGDGQGGHGLYSGLKYPMGEALR